MDIKPHRTERKVTRWFPVTNVRRRYRLLRKDREDLN